jgi:hypothetical protein
MCGSNTAFQGVGYTVIQTQILDFGFNCCILKPYRLPRRTAAQQVDMQMINNLTAIPAGINDRFVTG